MRSSDFWREMGESGHVCQVYANVDELVATLTGFIGGALWSGDSAVVIATDAHAARLEIALRQSGLDLMHLRADDRLLMCPAEATLARFLVDGWPDAARFASVIEPMLARARRGGRRVRAFGEMVNVLWQRGEYAPAVRLEHLWNRLIEREALQLLCAYDKPGFLRAPQARVHDARTAHSAFALG